MTDADVTTEYVKHALQIIRLSNGLRADASAKMRLLAVALRRLLVGENLANLSFPKLRSIVNEADDVAFKTFNTIEGAQSKSVADIIEMEAKWAQKTGQYQIAVKEAQIAKQIREFTVIGNTIEEQFDLVAQKFHNNLVQNLRQGVASGQTDKQIADRIVGVGPNMTGGVAEKTMRDVAAAVDTQTSAAADAGRRLAMKANGTNYLRWAATLDLTVCPNCGERDGKRWTIDGEPVGHDIPYQPIPLHPRCHCLYLPETIPQSVIDKGLKQKETFNEFLQKLMPEEQNHILGKGKAQLWREGKISLSDLIDQDGEIVTLRDLKESLQ